MTGKVIIIIIGLILGLVSVAFYAGMLWKSKTLGVAPKYQIQTPLEIQLSPTQRGKIPAGAVLYQYQALPEITTYYLFINLQETNILKPYKGEEKYNLVIPISAYPIE